MIALPIALAFFPARTCERWVVRLTLGLSWILKHSLRSWVHRYEVAMAKEKQS